MARRMRLVGLISLVGLIATIAGPVTYAQDATPSSAIDLPGRTADGAKTPLYLLNQLLTVPFDAALLPEGVANPVVSLWDYGDDDLVGATGGVTVELNDGQIQSINYIVYQSADDAANGILSEQPTDARPVPMATPAASGTTRVIYSLDDYVVCAEISGETAVIGGKLVAADRSTIDVGIESCALLDAGLAHLDALRAMP